MDCGCSFIVAQVDIVAVRSIAKIKYTTPVVEAIVLDVDLDGRYPAPFPVLFKVDVIVTSVK